MTTSVFNCFALKVYKSCRFSVDQKYSNNHVKQLQQWMLRHFCGLRIELSYAGMLGPTNKGFEGSGASFLFGFEGSVASFLFICDSLEANILSKHLREDLRCLTIRMGVLLALRRLEQIDMPSERDFPFEVELLSYSDRKKLLFKVALDHAKVLFAQSIENIDVVEIVESIGGIPLVLELLGLKFTKQDCSIYNKGKRKKVATIR